MLYGSSLPKCFVMIQCRFKILVREYMQVSFSSHEVIRGKESKQSENMITMQVTDKNMIDPGHVNRETLKLNLRTFSAIN